MKDNFDLKQFLVENKLTGNSKLLKDIEEQLQEAYQQFIWDKLFGENRE